MLLSFYFLSVIIGIYAYRQNDYIVIHERVEIYPNEEYLGNFKYKNFRYNRTINIFAFNMSFHKTDVNNAIRATVQGYKFMSNEYRLFPLLFGTNLCHDIREDLFGLQNIYSCGKMSRCPIKKGNYNLCNWQPDYHKFPPYAPSGSYRFGYNFSYLGNFVAYAQWYHTVKREVPTNTNIKF